VDIGENLDDANTHRCFERPGVPWDQQLSNPPRAPTSQPRIATAEPFAFQKRWSPAFERTCPGQTLIVPGAPGFRVCFIP
jgi:hypothetical protein